MAIMFPFVEIVKMKNGIFLMILFAKKLIKLVFIMEILIYYYMKEVSKIKKNYIYIL